MTRAITTLALLLGLVSATRGAGPLYDEIPYDKITLNAKNDGTVLLVAPIGFPDHLVPNPLPTKGKLVVRLTDRARKDYEVEWRAIGKIETFDQLVINAARERIRSGDLEEAFDYFAFLRSREYEVPGLAMATADYLFASAVKFQRDDDMVGSLGMLRELHRLDPNYPKAISALGTATNRLIEGYLEDENYWAARALVDELRALLPDHEVVVKWDERFQAEAEGLLDEAKQAYDGGDFRTAYQRASRIMVVTPGKEEAKELIEAICRDYRLVVVGVTSHPRGTRDDRMSDWAVRRTSRLTDRLLCEFVGAGTEGGEYVCPWGEVDVEDLGRLVAFRLLPDLRPAGGEQIFTGYDLSRRLLAMADPEDEARVTGWDDLFGAVSVRRVYDVDAELRRTAVRPQAFLQVTLIADSSSDDEEPVARRGPFYLGDRVENEVAYLVNRQYALSDVGRPQEILERRFAKGAEALWALKRGEIDVLDRVPPWQLDAVRVEKDLVVARYAVPLVHCLLPNMNKPLMARRGYRRALLYGIQRDTILASLVGADGAAGCRVVSGPFSAGFSLNDPLSYGYDPSVAPHRYDPRLATALAGVSAAQLASKLREEGKEVPDGRHIVLGHPPDDIARLACGAIKRQWELLGLEVELLELDESIRQTIPDSVDLLYAELAMWEPLVDARRLLGPNGLLGTAGPYMAQALSELDRAADWPEVGTRLRAIHRIAHTEVTVLPLWQLTDHYAYHRDVRGVGTGLVTLYQNVEDWQAPIRIRWEEE